MKTILALIIGSALLAAACYSAKTDTWQKVISTPHATGDAKDKSRAYAAGLHSTLLRAGIAHKVVVFQFQYSSKFTLKGSVERTAIIYKDTAEPKNPYWIMDDHLTCPVWLPNESVERQISFYVRRPTTVVSVTDFPASDDKAVKPLEKSARRKTAISRIQPVKQTQPVKSAQPAKSTQPTKSAKPVKSAQTEKRQAPTTQISKPAKSQLDPLTTITPELRMNATPASEVKVAPAPATVIEKKTPLINKIEETPQPAVAPEAPAAAPAKPKLRARPGLIDAPTSFETRKPSLIESLFAFIFHRS